MPQPLDHTIPTISKQKRRMFIVVTLLLPVLILALLEAMLRLVQYGPDLSLCTRTTVHGVEYYAMSGGVDARYFSGHFLGGTGKGENPAPEYFRMPKPDGTYRVFCLGGSTTAGYPFGVLGSFSRFLQERLQKMFPEKSIEVIDFGITATNSFTVLDMARDAMEYRPDLIIVYDGHNEFYGALGIASRESAGRWRGLGLAYMRLTHLKTFLLFSDVIDRVRSVFSSSTTDDPTGSAMERLARGKTIPYGSSIYYEALEWYKENMHETARICRDHGVPVIFSSQVSNLRDLPPFVSEFSETLHDADRTRFSKDYEAGMAELNNHDLAAALAHFRDAIKTDSLRADAVYRSAQCLELMGDAEAARSEYLRARDLDQLRFRQSTEFNQAVLAMTGPNVFVCDCESYFMGLSPKGLIGSNLILEHLHPTLYGYFLLGKALAATMRAHELLAPSAEWEQRDTLSDTRLWQDKIISPLDEAIGARRIAMLTSSWPFVQGQSSVGSGPAPRGELETIAKDVVWKKITWERGMVAAADYLEAQGRIDEARACYRSLIVHTPFNESPYLRLGLMLINHGRVDEGVPVLKQSLGIEPTQMAYQTLGHVAYEQNRLDEAITWLEQSKQHASTLQERTDASLGLALTYFRANDVGRAKSEVEYILTFNPGSNEARQFLTFIQTQH